MKPTRFLLVGATVALLTTCTVRATPVSFTGSYSQDFDSLASSGSDHAWMNETTLSGWSLFKAPAPGTAITTYSASAGASAGGFYSFGSAGSSERALGGVGSGSFQGWIAAAFKNETGGTLSSFTAEWNGEQWRNSSSANIHSMIFEYGFGNSFGTVSTWNTPGGTFDWSSPVTGGSIQSGIGNGVGLVSGVGGTISGLNWAANEVLWFRWTEQDDTGNDHALAIDDFSLTARSSATVGVPETLSPLWSIALLLPLVLARRLRVSAPQP